MNSLKREDGGQWEKKYGLSTEQKGSGSYISIFAVIASVARVLAKLNTRLSQLKFDIHLFPPTKCSNFCNPKANTLPAQSYCHWEHGNFLENVAQASLGHQPFTSTSGTNSRLSGAKLTWAGPKANCSGV